MTDPFPLNLQHIINPKPLELGSWNFERISTSDHVSHVTCHKSHVTCHVSGVRCQVSGGGGGGASRWRVCYQRGLPSLVSTDTCGHYLHTCTPVSTMPPKVNPCPEFWLLIFSSDSLESSLHILLPWVIFAHAIGTAFAKPSFNKGWVFVTYFEQTSFYWMLSSTQLSLESWRWYLFNYYVLLDCIISKTCLFEM